MELIERITAILEEKFRIDEAFLDCFIVEIELKGRNLYVFIDCDSVLDFAKCQKISRYLESHLDSHGWLGEQYVLEVSSPGLMRPFKFVRQYIKNIGREVVVTFKDKTQKIGLLKAADETKFTIEYEEVVLEGKKKKKIMTEKEITYDEVEKTLVKISF